MISPFDSPIERLRSLFIATGRRPSEGRFAEYALFDAHTGNRMSKKFPTRSEANAAKTSSAEPHRMRVRGVPPKVKKVKKKAVKS